MDEDRKSLYEAFQRFGVEMTVTNVFSGGELLDKWALIKIALTANQCIYCGCGQWEKRCSFKVPVRGNMKHARETFESEDIYMSTVAAKDTVLLYIVNTINGIYAQVMSKRSVELFVQYELYLNMTSW